MKVGKDPPRKLGPNAFPRTVAKIRKPKRWGNEFGSDLGVIGLLEPH